MSFEFNGALNYLFAWGLYLLSSVGVCVVFWRCTRWIKFNGLRRFLRATLVVVLFTPVVVSADKDWMAPAFLVGIYEYVLGNVELAQQAGYAMLIGIVVILLGLKLEFIIRKFLHLQSAE
jgi:membrane protease YdiL (CAAX protease family)